MKVSVHAVGRMKTGPEKELADRYFERFSKAGPALGLEFAGVTEIAESRAQTVAERKKDEAKGLQSQLSAGSALLLLDERGKNLSSEELSAWIASLRDNVQRHLLIGIGGPDGHETSLRSKADLVIAFGAQTWPHQMARMMLAEQLYRTATILAGHPYHRA